MYMYILICLILDSFCIFAERQDVSINVYVHVHNHVLWMIYAHIFFYINKCICT